MGNYSRNTYDAAKGYVAVRLQQGVPLLDSDWNEMNDIVRHEMYDAVNHLGTGVTPYSHAWEVQTAGANDLSIELGAGLVRGRPVRIDEPVTYMAQPWVNADRAAADGVEALPALTTPEEDRTDTVYLDVWEQEYDSLRDPAIVDERIGVETACRLKREVAFRVAEDASTMPAEGVDGHIYVPLAVLRRRAGKAEIEAVDINDVRPRVGSVRAWRGQAYEPSFVPTSGREAWRFGYDLRDDQSLTPVAAAIGEPGALGVLHLSFPDAAELMALNVQCKVCGSITFKVLRVLRGDSGPAEELSSEFVRGGSPAMEGSDAITVDCTRSLNISPEGISPESVMARVRIENLRYRYYLLVLNDSKGDPGKRYQASRIESLSFVYVV